MAISKLKEARYLLTKAEQLEREGRLKKAQIFFVKSREIYREICDETEPREQIGRSARQGLVKTTFKSEGLERATALLVSMIKVGDIPPITIEELYVYLGIKQV